MDDILKNLAETKVIIYTSRTHGIGVFAVQRIVKGDRDFLVSCQNWKEVPKSEIDSLPPMIISLVRKYCLSNKGFYYIPENGFKAIEPCMFLNHSKDANVASVNDGWGFEALRDIEVGEELFIDYDTLDDPNHGLT